MDPIQSDKYLFNRINVIYVENACSGQNAKV